MGDFNAYNPLWGSLNTNNRGKVIEKLLEETDLCLYNDGSPTYLQPATLAPSYLDLTITEASLFTHFSWSVMNNSYGSDHFPIVIAKVKKQSYNTTSLMEL